MGQRIQIVRQIEVKWIDKTIRLDTKVLHSHWGGYSTRHFLDLAVSCANVTNPTSEIRQTFEKGENYYEKIVETAKNTFKFSSVEESGNYNNDCSEFFKNIDKLRSANKVANVCDCNDGVIAIKITLTLDNYNKDLVRATDIDIKTAFFEAEYKDEKMITKKTTAKDLFYKWNMEYYESLLQSGEATGDRADELKEELKNYKKVYQFYEAGMALLNVSDWDEFRE